MSNQALIEAAITFASKRMPNGGVVAAAAETEQGRYLTGIWCDARVDAAALCAETGPICQAHALDDRILASVCVVRDNPCDPFRILPACGICQERLAFWGLDVLIGVPGTSFADICDYRALRDLRPHYWDTSANNRLNVSGGPRLT
jgi:cytidine deaminase